MLLDALSTVEGRGIKVDEDQREKIEEAVALLEADGGVEVWPLHPRSSPSPALPRDPSSRIHPPGCPPST